MFADLSLRDLDRSDGAAAIGVDVGGTKTALGLIDAASLTLLATDVIPTGRERGGEAVLQDVSEHAAALARTATRLGRRTVGVGVAVPEIVNLAGQIISTAVIPRWNELPVAATLGAIAPAVVEADVRAAAFAEASLGAGRDYGFHLFVTIGTGISYCAVGAGRPFAGAHGGALNVGTSVLTLPAGPPCPDGPADREVVLERIASGSALAERYAARGGTAQGAEDVLAAARAGDPAAREVLNTGAEALGIGIALLVNLLDPEAVITGGGLGSADTEYWTAAERWTRHYAHSHAAGIVLRRGQLGPDAGVIGAGMAGLLAPHRLRHGAADHGAADHGAAADGAADHGSASHGATKHGATKHDAANHDGTNRGVTDRGTPGRGNADGIPNYSCDKRK
jgi:glucokinase